MSKLAILIFNSNNQMTNLGGFDTEEECLQWMEQNKNAFPEDFTYNIISAGPTQQEKRLEESEEALNLGFKLMAKIRATNRRKLKLGLWTESQFNALLSSSVASQVERALWNGSLETAAYLVTNLSSFYSDIEINEIVEEINAHEQKWSNLT